MMAGVVVNFFGGLIMVLVVSIVTCCVQGAAAIVTAVTFTVLCILFNIIIHALVLKYSLTALDDPTCKSAMLRDGEINSVSADTGGALLAITRMVNSIFSLVCIVIFVCCLACSISFYQYMRGHYDRIHGRVGK